MGVHDDIAAEIARRAPIAKRATRGLGFDEASEKLIGLLSPLPAPFSPNGEVLYSRPEAVDSSTVMKVLRRVGRNSATYKARVARGVDKLEAALEPVTRRKPTSIASQCIAAGITYHCYGTRRRRGLSHEAALTTPLR